MTILVYLPKNAPKGVNPAWLYGTDIVDELKRREHDWIFKEVDGSCDECIWDGVDVLLRPVRHDGISRMVLEAFRRDIPYIWSYETGEFIEPNVDDIERRLLKLEEKLHE